MIPFFIGSIRCNTHCHCHAQSRTQRTLIRERVGCEGLGKLFHGLWRSVISDMCTMYVSQVYTFRHGETNMWTISRAHAYREPTIPSGHYLSREDIVIVSYPESWSKKNPWIGRSHAEIIPQFRYIHTNLSSNTLEMKQLGGAWWS